MTLAQKQQTKAEEYRVQALGASALADASVLARVRDMHLRAAEAWTGMAELQDRAALESELRIAIAQRALLNGPSRKSEEGTPMRSVVPGPAAAQ
jgi:hypothetical protein